jgi:O-antigen ligase
VALNVRSSPLIGRGPATYLPKYRILDNTWLTFVIEVGLIGVAALLAFYCVPAYLGRVLRRASRDPMMRAIGLAAIGLSLLIVIESATFDFFAYPMSPGFLMLLVGVVACLAATASAERAVAGEAGDVGGAADPSIH